MPTEFLTAEWLWRVCRAEGEHVHCYRFPLLSGLSIGTVGLAAGF